MLKAIASVWYRVSHEDKRVGIVIAESDTGSQVAFIGTGRGRTRLEDEYNVLKRGAKFPVEQAQVLINQINDGSTNARI